MTKEELLMEQAEDFQRLLKQPMNARSRDVLLKGYQECLIELRELIINKNRNDRQKDDNGLSAFH